ncbi:hypothetical protein B7494_g1871 [Chlorociboria aeruginascens]|nr:hypothetical protein B7494_g1871 [Chlorociboria aeruginascens]
MQLSEESKERIGKVIDISRVAIHYGFLPMILYLANPVLALSDSSRRSDELSNRCFAHEPRHHSFRTSTTNHDIFSMTDNHVRLSPALVETFAGLSAGTISTLAVHPLDVIKTRLQIHRSKSTTPITGFKILRTLTQNPKPIQSLYRGLTPNLVGNASSWALFFYFKSSVERQISRFHEASDGHKGHNLTAGDYFAASGIAGIFITLSTNPIWVLKTRMLSSDRGSQGAYTNMWQGARSILQKEGVRGFYRGVGISMLGVGHGAVQFAIYEPMKNFWQRYLHRGYEREIFSFEREKLGNSATIIISGAAKIVAGTVTYPYQVIRSRLQTYDAEQRFGRGVTGVVGMVWREEGARGFYRGMRRDDTYIEGIYGSSTVQGYVEDLVHLPSRSSTETRIISSHSISNHMENYHGHQDAYFTRHNNYFDGNEAYSSSLKGHIAAPFRIDFPDVSSNCVGHTR